MLLMTLAMMLALFFVMVFVRKEERYSPGQEKLADLKVVADKLDERHQDRAEQLLEQHKRRVGHGAEADVSLARLIRELEELAGE